MSIGTESGVGGALRTSEDGITQAELLPGTWDCLEGGGIVDLGSVASSLDNVLEMDTVMVVKLTSGAVLIEEAPGIPLPKKTSSTEASDRV
ncbi:hypothetical protein ACH5RR_021686 [Cinchona calisaya]|uniref:Uncharacterized protein n=1 Tax=Cinchona calisaya TaxID=153742 RepID=A0ABD2ZKZ2_9GENT